MITPTTKVPPVHRRVCRLFLFLFCSLIGFTLHAQYTQCGDGHSGVWLDGAEVADDGSMSDIPIHLLPGSHSLLLQFYSHVAFSPSGPSTWVGETTSCSKFASLRLDGQAQIGTWDLHGSAYGIPDAHPESQGQDREQSGLGPVNTRVSASQSGTADRGFGGCTYTISSQSASSGLLDASPDGLTLGGSVQAATHVDGLVCDFLWDFNAQAFVEVLCTFTVPSEVTVTIRLSPTAPPVNSAPVAGDDDATTDEKTVLNAGAPGLLGNDADPDQGPLVTYRFAGHMLAADVDFTAGQPFTGFYSLDPASVGTDHPDWTLTFQYVTQNAPWELSFADSGYKFGGNMAVVDTGNDTAFGDRYIATLYAGASTGTPLPSGRQLSIAQFDLQDPTGAGADLLQDDSIQATTVHLAAAQIAGGRFLFGGGSQPQLGLDQLDGPLSVTQVNSQAASVNQLITLPSGALLRVNSNGSFRYDPNGRFASLALGATATETFTYEVSDREGATATATARITVTGVNDAPVANPDSFTILEDASLRVDDVLSNDTDVDGDPLTVAEVGLPSHGDFGDLGGGVFGYVPAPNYTGQDSFSYVISDGHGGTATATADITVSPVNDAPADRDRTVYVQEDQGGGQTQPKLDVDGDPITYAVVTSPLHGSVVTQGGNLIYLPAPDYNGPDSFAFQGTDGTLESPVYTYSIVVLPVNDAPAAQAQAVITPEDTAVAISLSGSDVDGDAVSYTVASVPNHGILSGTPPNLIYLPSPDYYGPDLFTFTVADGQAVSAAAVVNLSVTDTLMDLASLSPVSATADGSGFTLTVTGSGFEPDTVVYWNGSGRPTTYVSPTQVMAEIPASDLADVTDIRTVQVTAGEPMGSESGVAIFTIVPANVGEVQTALVPAGEAGTVSSPPTSITEPGVTVSVQNDDGSSMTVVAATYNARPTGETVFKVDSGSFVDVQFTGADGLDVATVRFYYPAAITDGAENRVKLRYFDGANWSPVLSRGGVAPVKDTTDNLDSTLSGGRFLVVFDDTSTPKLTDLTGTVFGLIDSTPQLGTVSGPAGPVPLGTAVTVSVPYAVVGNPMAAQITFLWDDGSQTTVSPAEAGSASATHLYAAPGVYGVTLQVMDAEGDRQDVRYQYVVIYDPSGGFVTGGGWIESPAGAYVANPALTGRAEFGFVSKYQKGATVPTGTTEFQFQAGDFRFHSVAYEWLVVAGAKAQYKGVGQVNGAGDYGFLLTTTDGQLTGGGGVDKLRMKIWERASGTAVYDNRLGASDDLDDTDPQQLGGGGIAIHKSR